VLDRCNHTLYHKDQNQKLQGSWTEELVVDSELGQRLRVACGACGKFYGYATVPNGRDATAPSRAADENTTSVPQPPQEPNPLAESQLPELPILKNSDRTAYLDYLQIRKEVSMLQVLELVGFKPTSTRGNQLRGPCPIHRSGKSSSRSFSVNIERGVFQCFGCGKRGNQLDLYAAVTGLQLYEAARDLCLRLGRKVPYLD
jgi:hypothetical protein